ncbi:hypothetical protein XcmpCFBP7700_12575 [Xanthomonas campestris]|nr:hypothetical protein XcmpCFBP7700_12575 [Xanthomonas campestris]
MAFQQRHDVGDRQSDAGYVQFVVEKTTGDLARGLLQALISIAYTQTWDAISAPQAGLRCFRAAP